MAYYHRKRFLMYRERLKFISYRKKLREFDPMDIPEQRFKELYRLTKSVAQDLINLLTPHFDPPQRTTGKKK